MSKRVLLAPAGWEARYFLGVENDIEEFKPTVILIPYSSTYESRTKDIRSRLQDFAKARGIEFICHEQDYVDQVNLYNSVQTVIEDLVVGASAVRFNVTTTPRDFIWNALHIFSDKKTNLQISYYKPEEYGTYLSRDAKAPRFVLKRSGIAFPDRPTCILALSGFDEERLSQLKQRYEPRKMLIGVQTGDQLGNKQRNVNLKFTTKEEGDSFDFDCYDPSEESVQLLCKKVDDLDGEFNVIAASLGPKPSALTLFKLTQLRPDVGLVYIPAGDYSADYSKGINLNNKILAEVSW